MVMLLASKMCDIYNTGGNNIFSVSGWIINDILHFMSCNSTPIENIGLYIVLESTDNICIQQMNMIMAQNNAITRTDNGPNGKVLYYIPKNLYQDVDAFFIATPNLCDKLRRLRLFAVMAGGKKDSYQEKYLKYKKKYIELKNNIEKSI